MRCAIVLSAFAVVGSILGLGCDRLLVTDADPSAQLRFGLDLSTLAPAASARAAGACVTVMQRATLRVDGAVRAQQTLDPSDTLHVFFGQVEVEDGQVIQAEIHSNTGALLFENSVVFEGQRSMTITVTPQAPVLWVCPPSLARNPFGEEVMTVSNGGRDTLSWFVEAAPGLVVRPPSGEVTPGERMPVIVRRTTSQAGSTSLIIGSPQGAVTLPVTVAANGAPFVVNELPDRVLSLGETVAVDLAEVFEDPVRPLRLQLFQSRQ